MSEEKSDKACEEIQKTFADVTNDLMSQLQRKPSDEAKVYLIYLLGRLRDVRAANLLTDYIDLKAPKLDPLTALPRWGPYPAADALTNIGEMAVREISSRLPKDQTALRRELMVEVIWDVYGERCSRIYLEDALARQTTAAGKANLKLSLQAYDAIKGERQLRRELSK